jgi:hypothetical protein
LCCYEGTHPPAQKQAHKLSHIAMGSHTRSPDSDGLEAHPGPDLPKRRKIEDQHAAVQNLVGAKISRYKDVVAQGQAYQHNGNNFHGPVTIQNSETPSGTPIVLDQKAERHRFMDSLIFEAMDARFIDVQPHLVGTCKWLPATPEYKRCMDPRLMPTDHGFFWIKGKVEPGE